MKKRMFNIITKEKKKKIYHFKITATLITMILIILTSCTEEIADKYKTVQQNDRTITLRAVMPQDNPSTRISLEENEGSLNLIAKWEEEDVIQLFYVQGETIAEGSESTVFNLSQDGKTSSFNITVPKEIDLNTPFDLYAFCGIPEQGVQLIDGEILADITPQKSISLDNFSVPVWTKVEAISLLTEEVELTFNHLGAYEVIHLRNADNEVMEVSESYLIPKDSNSPLWYYHADDESTPVFNPVSGGFTTIQGEPISKTTSDIVVEPATTKTIVSWYVPNDNNIPKVGLKINENESVNIKDKKDFAMQSSKAYHVYAISDCAKTVLTNDEYKTEFPKLGTGVEVELKHGMEKVDSNIITFLYSASSGEKIHIARGSGGTTVTYTDFSFNFPVTSQFWGSTPQSEAEGYSAIIHEKLNGKHIKDRLGKGRTMISPTGLKMTMSSESSRQDEITSLTILDNGVVQHFNIVLKTIEYSDYNPDFANYLDAIQPDGETSTYGLEGDWLVFYNIYYEESICNRIHKRMDLGAASMINSKLVNKLYVNGTDYP